MDDEAPFHAALDENPADIAMRLVFADWLEERGDWRAEGYRWMGQHHKWPTDQRADDGLPWGWWSVADPSSIHAELPQVLHRPMYRVLSPEYAWAFETRREAEETLCRAIRLSRDLDARPDSRRPSGKPDAS
jgi:uncharacterized protein (TIGR02996 family)